MSVLSAWIGGLTDSIGYIVSEEQQGAIDAANRKRIEKAIAQQRQARVAALQQGATQVGQLRARGTAVEGQQRLAYAVGNIDATSGTAAQTQASSRIFTELDVNTTRNNARAAALGHDAVLDRYDDALKDIERQKKARDTAFAMKFAGRALDFTAGAIGGGS
jgi:hypothetical protein